MTIFDVGCQAREAARPGVRAELVARGKERPFALLNNDGPRVGRRQRVAVCGHGGRGLAPFDPRNGSALRRASAFVSRSK